jgi:hypothetical protein
MRGGLDKSKRGDEPRETADSPLSSWEILSMGFFMYANIVLINYVQTPEL